MSDWVRQAPLHGMSDWVRQQAGSNRTGRNV
jgi:hypothetical protein